MRNLLIMPAVVLVACGVGWGICAALGLRPIPRDVIAATIIALLAAELAVVPLILVSGASQFAVAQAGLVATIVHLFTFAALGGGIMMLKPFPHGTAFVYWLLGLYWMSLIALAILCARAVKAAPVDARAGGRT